MTDHMFQHVIAQVSTCGSKEQTRPGIRQGQDRNNSAIQVDVGAAWTPITVLWLCTPNLSEVITRLETGCLMCTAQKQK